MENGTEKLKNDLENTAKLIGIIGGVCYATGLCITLIDFSQYGLLAVDFLSPQYILTGGIFYFFIISAVFLNFLFILDLIATNSTRKHRPDLPSFFWLSRIFSILIWLILILLIGNFFFHQLSLNERLKLLGYYLLIALPTIGFIRFNDYLASIEKPTTNNAPSTEVPNKRVTTFDLHFTTANIFTIIFIGGIFIYIYSMTLYKYLPTSFGGGRLSHISLTIKNDDYNSDMKNMIVLRDSLHNAPIKYELVKESTFEYYILLSRNPNKIIQIPKRIVQGAIISQN